MQTKSTLIELLLKQSEMYLRDLPETIRIPALNSNRADEVVRPLEDATVDDLARKRGALGVTTLAAAFADLAGEGGQK
jgi:hypothetical protein